MTFRKRPTRTRTFRSGGTFKATDISVEFVVPACNLRLDLEASHRMHDLLGECVRNFGLALTKRHGDNGRIFRSETITVVLFNGQSGQLEINSNSNMTRFQMRRMAMSMIGVPLAKLVELAQNRKTVQAWVLDRAARRAWLEGLEIESPLNPWIAERLAERARRTGQIVKPVTDEELRCLIDDPPSEYNALCPERPIGGIPQLAWCADCEGGVPL